MALRRPKNPTTIEVKCRAKVNLYLRVLGRRADGYHDIVTIYHAIELHDLLRLKKRDAGIAVTCSHPDVPTDESNLAFRAASRLLASSGGGIEIEIEKSIPVAAGLGGGSADAAGTLVGLNRLLDLGLSDEVIGSLASEIGADVRFMIRGGCAVGKGRGDELSFLKPLSGIPVLLALPDLNISTSWAYESVKIGLTTRRVNLSMIAKALEKGQVCALGDLLHNDFESVVFEKHPIVRQVKHWISESGACAALMSGSGPVVFGIFDKEGDADRAKRFLEARGLRVIDTSFAANGVTA